MLVLGIESSCDETAAAVVENGERILSSVVASQVSTHQKYGGVVPELASREHLRRIAPIVEEACRHAGIGLADIEGIAVTEGPGLIGSLLVGLVYGKALALALGKPLIGVNHLEGHIQSVLLENKRALHEGRETHEARLPAVALVVSGGHTSLFRVEAARPEVGSRHKAVGSGEPGFGVRVSGFEKRAPSSGDAQPTSAKPETQNPNPESTLPSAYCLPLAAFSYTRLGQTRDDAAGEAFDKVAKLLALGYPGGPVIDNLARFGNPRAVEFGRIRMKGNPLDFSFSGLKTAVLYRLRGTALETEAQDRRAWSKSAGQATADEIRSHCSAATLDLIASFQRAAITDLVERTLLAADNQGVDSILVCGGVACNSLLHEFFHEAAASRGLRVFFPSPALSTDNAAMIAAAGYYRIAAGLAADASLTAHASLPLGTENPEAGS